MLPISSLTAVDHSTGEALVITEDQLKSLPVQWKDLLQAISSACITMVSGDFSQPLKPYLRYRDPRNRIIAMPAYLGGDPPVAGIKWIASFPENITRGLPRAHSVVILNEYDTGRPFAIFTGALLSGLRTAAVTGTLFQKIFQLPEWTQKNLRVGIIGCGPIGTLHLRMITSLWTKKLERVFVYDLDPARSASLQNLAPQLVEIHTHWKTIYDEADIVINCTVSKERYVDIPAQPGKIYANVSLRDYHSSFFDSVGVVVVDDWTEVCRENTDIENGFKAGRVTEDKCLSFPRIVCATTLPWSNNPSIMFNPMGLALFDLAIARHFYGLQLAELITAENKS